MPKLKDIAGQRFGRWFVVGRVEGSKPARWHVRCDCGKEVVRLSGNLLAGMSGSCGCFRTDSIKTRTAVGRVDRFWSKVNKDGPVCREELGPCWVWTAGLTPWGYGTCSPKHGSPYAHRAAWIMANGPIPDGLWVLHRCDAPACVRSEHLFLGDVADNNADKTRKGRQARKETHGEYHARGASHGSETHPEKFKGEGNNKAKLTEAQVIEIRARTGEASNAALGREFGVKAAAVGRIRRGLTWRHLPAKAG